MDKTVNQKLSNLEYIMQELAELRLHVQDLKDEHYLLMHDNRAIRHTTNVRKLILTRDYFKVDETGCDSDLFKEACKQALRNLEPPKPEND